MQNKSHRLVFIDIMRGIACFWMIETHVLNQFLDYTYRGGFLYERLNFLNGYVSVGFIFCAGAGFWLALERKIEEYRAFGQPLWTYLRRLLYILVAAYFLQVPEFSLLRTLNIEQGQISQLVRSDVLHAIVFSSFAALSLILLPLDRLWLRYLFFAIAGVVFLTTSYVWTWDASQVLPVFPASLFARQPESPFPLFPWSGYFFAGAAITSLFVSSGNKHRFSYWLVGIGGITFGAMFIARYVSLPYGGHQEWWYSSPYHAFLRVSGPMMLFGTLYLFEQHLQAPRYAFLRLVGQESFFVYVTQGMFIFGSVASIGIRHFLPAIITPWTTAILTIVISVVVYALAHMWHWYKSEHRQWASRTVIAFSAIIVLIFLLVPLK